MSAAGMGPVLRSSTRLRRGSADCGPSRPQPSPVFCDPTPIAYSAVEPQRVDSAAHLGPGEIESEPAEADLALDHLNVPPSRSSTSHASGWAAHPRKCRLLRAPAQADSAAAPGGTGRAFVDELNPRYLKGGHHLR